MKRRRFLTTVLSGTAVTLSGCSAQKETNSKINLEYVSVRNLHDEQHTIVVEVLRNGNRFEKRTVSVEGKTNEVPSEETLAVISDDIEKEPAKYEIRTKFDRNQRWTVASPTAQNLGDCLGIEIRISETGKLGIWEGYLSDC